MSPRWAARRLVTGLLAFILSPVLAAVLGLPMAQAAPNPPVPMVSFDMPSNPPLIGEEVGFDVSFVNDPLAEVGYGPYVDLRMPLGADGNDGLTFISATYLGAPVTAVQLTADIYGHVLHPYAIDASGAPVQVTGLALGQSYVVLRLPFGSFTPGQPAAVVHVTTQLSNLANVDVPLPIVANGGFQFGATPLDDPATDPSIVGNTATTAVVPKIMRITKTYNGPEDETATGPNYPRSYTLRVAVAPGQDVTDLTVTDSLPDTLQYLSTNTPTTPASTLTEPSTSTPGGTVSADFPFVHGTGGTDATLTFNFFVPRLDSGSAPVLPPATGAFNTSTDSASASGTWDPIDTLDPTIDATAGPATHTLTDKSIAIQKTVAKVGSGPVAPGDTLEWTLSVQVSDHFALDSLVVDDLLGDGTRFDPGFTPTLSVDGNGFSLGAADMANYTVSPVGGTTGKTPISFRLSSELVTRGQDGRMVGGCIDPVDGSVPPNCSLYNNGPTTATIVFHSTVQQTYIDGRKVVEGDTLVNHAAATGMVMDTGSFDPTGNSIGDGTAGVGVAGTAAQVTIERGTLEKTIYAVNGHTDFTPPVHVAPGDTVTYRLKQTFPESRTDDFRITDYLPLPVFYAAGVATWDGDFSGSAPDAGHYSYGPADTFHLNPGAHRPVGSSNTTSNSVEFAYGDYALYPPASSVADILFTVTVSTDPFADGLLLTNQARSQTRNAAGTLQTADAIIQITLDQPVLSITKGVVGTDRPSATFTPADMGPVNFAAPPAVACPGFNTGLVTTSSLAAHPVDSNLSGVDAGDNVRFAIAVQNKGHANAFGVKLQDTIPAGFVKPAAGFNICIADGAGTAMDAINVSDGHPIALDGGAGLFDQGIKLVDGTSGSLPAGVDGTTVNDAGTNIAVITYTLRVDTSAVPKSVVTNTASLLNYINSPSATKSHLASPLTDTATVTMAPPAAAKVATEGSLASTVLPNVTIGEIVTYQVTLTVPEGTLPDARVVDTLPAGLALVDCKSIEVSPEEAAARVTTSQGGFGAACNAGTNPTVGTGGQLVTFSLGTITNADTDNSAAETVVIKYHAVVLNVSDNVRGHMLRNSAVLSWTGGSIAPVTSDLNVVEPLLTITKSASPTTGDAGDSLHYTITVSNQTDSNGSDAFGVSLTDIVPAGMTYSTTPTALVQSGGLAATTISDAGAPTLSATWAAFPMGSSATFEFYATLNSSVAPGNVLTNQVDVSWSSLPGTVTAHQSDFNDVSTERTDDTGDPGGSLNDYGASDSAQVTVPLATTVKDMTGTSLADTTDPNVAVGEVVGYRIVLKIPEGQTPSAKLVDTLPAGLAFKDCTGISASAGLTTSLGADFSSACANNGSNPAPGLDGQHVTFDLGTITNADRRNNVAETITITYEAVVLNVSGNTRGTELHNSAVLSWTGGTSPAASAADLNVVEPIMTVVKTPTPATGDAGDEIIYTVTIRNPTNPNGATAYNVDWTDTIPVGLTYVNSPAASLIYKSGNVPDTLTSSGPTGASLHATWASFPASGTPTVLEYKVTLDSDVQPGQNFDNSAALTWMSLPDSVAGQSHSDYNPLAVKRTGNTGDLGGSTNTYKSTSTVRVSVTQPAPTKTIPVTSETNPANPYVAIGEIVRYRVAVIIPEGYFPNANIYDQLPAGLTFLNDNTTKVAFVADTGMTSDAFGDAALHVSDNSTWAGDPTYVLPGAQIGGGPFGDGADPVFNLGNLTNSDRDPNGEAVVIEFNARVDNLAGHTRGTTLSNTASIRKDTTTLSTSAGGPISTVTIAEPSVTFTKSITTTPTDAGDTVVYRIAVANGSAADVSPAYDVHVTDTLDANLTFVSAAAGHGPGNTTTVATDNNPGSGSVDFTFDAIAPGATEYLDITATVSGTVDAGQTIPNTAYATWTSLPGAHGTTGNDTGSDNTGNPGDADGERTGSGTSPNNYLNNSTRPVTLAVPSISKLGPAPATASIGDTTTFDLVVTLPEGTTRSLAVVDNLPAGLIPVSYSVVTSAASSGGRLAYDFNGTLPVPAETAKPAGSAGGSWTLTFGDTVTNADNSITDNNSFLVRVTAQVANVVGNQSGVNLLNTASVQYTQGGTQTVAAPTPRFVTITEPVLQLSKSADITSPRFNATVTYTLTISHATGSNATACDVSLTDTLPVGLTYVASSLQNTAGAVPTSMGESGGVITITFDSSPLATTSTFTYRATVGDAGSVGLKQTLTNSARTTWTSLPTSGDPNERTGNPSDPGGALNDYVATTTASVVVSGIDLTIAKTDGQAQATAGAVRTYALTYHNVGNQTATVATITEHVPTGTTFRSAGSTAGWNCANGAAAETLCTHLAGSGTLVAGASGSVNFAVAVVDPIPSGLTQISNTATIDDDHTKNLDPTPDNNTATDADQIPQADLSLTKSVDDSTPDAGQVVVFTLTVSNAPGLADATNVKVTDTLPGSLTYLDSTPNSGGSYDAGTGVWTVGTVASGGSETMTLRARVTSPGTATNVAEVTHSDQGDPDSTPGNGVTSEDDYAFASVNPTVADLGVTKVVDVLHPNVGDDVTYTIVATNYGPSDATGVKVTDVLPAGITYKSSTPPGAYDPATHTCVWTIGDLGNGASTTLTLVATVAGPGTIVNPASIRGDPFDPKASNDTASATISQLIDLVVTKSVDNPAANVGTTATFTIGVSNSGPSLAHNVHIRDLLPAADLTYVSATPSVGTTYDPATGNWNVGTLAVTGSATLTLRANVVNPNVSTNTASVLSVTEPQSDTTNDSRSATVTPSHADLAITKSVLQPRPNVGDGDSFTLTVTNKGPDAATGVAAVDVLPAGIDYVSHSASQGGYDSTTGHWSIGTLAKDASATLTINVHVASANDYTNTATVSGDQYDPTPSDNTASVSLSTRVSDIEVKKVSNKPAPAVGTTVIFTVTATNKGPDPATQLVIHDALPAGLTYISNTPSGSTTYNPTTGDWTIGGLANGAAVTLDITARVVGSGSIGNTAAVTSLLQRDPVHTNDQDTATIDVPPAADLSLTKTVDVGVPDLGTNVTFTVIVTNHGPNGTAGVHVGDLLPAGLTYVSGTHSAGAYDSTTGDWDVGDMGVGAVETLTIKATVAAEGPITNTAEVTASSLFDPNSTPGNHAPGENDQSSAVLNSRGVADLAVAKSVSPASVRKGDQVAYTIVVTNHGPDGATGVIVRDQLPSGVTYLSSSGGTYNSTTGAWTVGGLASGSSSTLTIKARVGQTGSITNTAEVAASNQRDPDPNNDEATAGIAAAGPTLPPTGTRDSGRAPLDLGQLAVWLLGFTLAAIAAGFSMAMASRNRRSRLHR